MLVAHRINDFRPVPAWRAERVLVSDEAGRRYFWLLDEAVQLVYEPYGWHNEWYVDIVDIAEEGDVVTITDRYVDVIVEGMGPTYRMLDLEEAGDALLGGRLTAAELAGALGACQRFLDRYLHRGAPFPPPAIRPLFAADHAYPPTS